MKVGATAAIQPPVHVTNIATQFPSELRSCDSSLDPSPTTQPAQLPSHERWLTPWLPPPPPPSPEPWLRASHSSAAPAPPPPARSIPWRGRWHRLAACGRLTAGVDQHIQQRLGITTRAAGCKGAVRPARRLPRQGGLHRQRVTVSALSGQHPGRPKPALKPSEPAPSSPHASTHPEELPRALKHGRGLLPVQVPAQQAGGGQLGGLLPQPLRLRLAVPHAAGVLVNSHCVPGVRKWKRGAFAGTWQAAAAARLRRVGGSGLSGSGASSGWHTVIQAHL